MESCRPRAQRVDHGQRHPIQGGGVGETANQPLGQFPGCGHHQHEGVAAHLDPASGQFLGPLHQAAALPGQVVAVGFGKLLGIQGLAFHQDPQQFLSPGVLAAVDPARQGEVDVIGVHQQHQGVPVQQVAGADPGSGALPVVLQGA